MIIVYLTVDSALLFLFTMNIFVTFSNKHGTTANALKHLNQNLGKSYTHSRFSQWASGRALPHMDTYRFIHMEVLDYVLKNSSLNEAMQEMLRIQLSLPDQGD